MYLVSFSTFWLRPFWDSNVVEPMAVAGLVLNTWSSSCLAPVSVPTGWTPIIGWLFKFLKAFRATGCDQTLNGALS